MRTHIAWALLMFVLSLGITGYDSHHSNQALQIPIVHLWNDPDLYPGDPLAEALSGYTTVVWPLVAYADRLLPLETVLLLGFLTERFLLIVAAGAAGAALLPHQRWAPVASMAAFAIGPDPFLGSGTLVETYLEQTGVAIVVLLFALAAFLRGNRFTWAVLCGVAFNVNPLYTAYAMTYFSLAVLLTHEHRSEWKRWVLPGAVFVCLSLPMFIWARRAQSHGEVDSQLWVEIGRLRHHHHLFPHTVALSKIWKHVVLSGWLLAIVIAGARREAGTRRLTLALFVASLGWACFALVAAYIAPAPSTLVWQPMRGSDIWFMYLGIALPSLIASGSPDSGVARRVIGSLPLAIFLVLWSPWRAIRPIAPVALLLVALAPAVFRRCSSIRPCHPYAMILVVTLVMLAAINTAERFAETGEFLTRGPGEEILQISEWARELSSRDSLFLTPPVDFIQFRSLSQRSSFCDHKDAAAIFLHRPYASEWNRRMLALGYDSSQHRGDNRKQLRRDLRQAYEDLTDQDLQRLSEEYALDYWIVRRDRVTSFPVAFETTSHKVLAVTGD
jgi:hypothetical protein